MSKRDARPPGSAFWDERYRADGFAYGTAPNRWLAAQAARIPPGGRVLSLGEGEGRNAVWLAEQGLTVDAVDGSAVGLEKAHRLAAERGVRIRTIVGNLATFRPDAAAYDALVLVYLHLPPAVRAVAHAAGAAGLRPGGIVIVEAFSHGQLGRESGGPRQPELLYDVAVLRADFPGFEWHVLEEVEVHLDEGPFHRGLASVVRGVGQLGEAPGS